MKPRIKRRIKRALWITAAMLFMVFAAYQPDRNQDRNSSGHEYEPVKTAVYALEYCGWDSLTDTKTNENTIFAEKCVQWLIDHASGT